MAVYKVSAVAPGQRSLRVFFAAVVLLFLCLLVFSSLYPEAVSDRVRHLLGYVAGAIALLSLFIGLAHAGQLGIWKSVRNFQVELTEEKIVLRRPESSDVQIPVSEIREIREFSNWLLVRGSEPLRVMVIPRMLLGYEGLRDELAGHHKILRPKLNMYLLSFVPGLLGWVSVFVLIFSRERATALVSAAVIAIVSAWGFYWVWRLFKTKPMPRLLIFIFVVNGLALLWILFDKLRPIT